jgi:hypothetical protein
LKRRKENIVFVNGGHAIVTVSIYKSNMITGETFPNKGILEKLIRERKNLVFYTTVNKVESLNKP